MPIIIAIIIIIMSDLFFEKESLEYDSEEEAERSARVEGSERSSHNPQAVHKNKYINKIRDLGAEERGTKEECSVRSLDKKERNKFSAKQSRDRKKFYIEMLEEKQRALSKQL